MLAILQHVADPDAVGRAADEGQFEFELASPGRRTRSPRGGWALRPPRAELRLRTALCRPDLAPGDAELGDPQLRAGHGRCGVSVHSRTKKWLWPCCRRLWMASLSAHLGPRFAPAVQLKNSAPPCIGRRSPRRRGRCPPWQRPCPDGAVSEANAHSSLRFEAVYLDRLHARHPKWPGAAPPARQSRLP